MGHPRLYFAPGIAISRTKNFKIMDAKKTFSMDVLIDCAMTKLFLLAEYVCDKCSPVTDEPAATKDVVPTIHFSAKDYVEGELF